jgi:hypothetical protein
MALMLQQAVHDLLQGPLPITEPEAAGGRDAVELLVSQLSQNGEDVSASRHTAEQAIEIDVLGGVVTIVRVLLVATLGVVAEPVDL